MGNIEKLAKIDIEAADLRPALRAAVRRHLEGAGANCGFQSFIDGDPVSEISAAE
ncbi:hypothetical protein ACFVUS_25650 [Nocardia sp. NPDC058058]|uniref:hypothetical protein n=1 Tax=Nocardia sp. NPDC058058 TaxID=3346317 RepID=UPI0036DD508A